MSTAIPAFILLTLMAGFACWLWWFLNKHHQMSHEHEERLRGELSAALEKAISASKPGTVGFLLRPPPSAKVYQFPKRG